jgi:hypothetical protein
MKQGTWCFSWAQACKHHMHVTSVDHHVAIFSYLSSTKNFHCCSWTFYCMCSQWDLIGKQNTPADLTVQYPFFGTSVPCQMDFHRSNRLCLDQWNNTHTYSFKFFSMHLHALDRLIGRHCCFNSALHVLIPAYAMLRILKRHSTIGHNSSWWQTPDQLGQVLKDSWSFAALSMLSPHAFPNWSATAHDA